MSSTIFKNKIPFLDLQRQYLSIKDEVLKVTEQVFDAQSFSQSDYVEQFEDNFSNYCSTGFCAGLSNGTSAIHMAIRGLGIGKGDEVLIPANTYIASVWGSIYEGATPVFVDCNPHTWNVDINELEKRITPKTKAIMAVHLYGQPCDMEAILNLANKHNLLVIEDASHAHGAKLKGQKVGGFGDAGCFSFYPGKNLGAYGEAGAITTNNADLDKTVKIMRNQGSENKYWNTTIGYNLRMDGLQGAILDIKLKYLDEWNEKRKAIAQRYQTEITHPEVRWQIQAENTESVYHLFVITVKERDRFMRYMNDHNVFPGLHYPVPCHLQEALQYLGYQQGDFPNSEKLSAHCVSLPMFAELLEDEVSYIIEKINHYK